MQQQNTACGVACAHVCGRGAQHMGSARSGLRGLRCGGAAHLRCRTRVSSDAARKRSLRLDAGRPMMSSERPSSSAEVQANGRWSRCRASRPTAGGVDLGKRTQAISDIFFFFNIFLKQYIRTRLPQHSTRRRIFPLVRSTRVLQNQCRTAVTLRNM